MDNQLIDTITAQKEILKKALKENYVPRTVFSRAEEFAKTSLIKVILGPRRAGKSTLSLLLLKDKPFAFLNMDDEQLSSVLKKTKTAELLDTMFAVYGKTEIILFDEIQNLEGWELFANKLHRSGYNLFLTGSNANLLSKELATHLTGRHFPIEVLPFDFKEYLSAKKFNFAPDAPIVEKGELLNHLKEYMTNGGYPEVVVNGFNAASYLSTLYDATIFKDVISRHKAGLPQKKITDLGSHAINNVTNEFSYNSLRSVIDVKRVETVQKYLGFLEESYILFILNRFSYSDKKRIKSPKKFYVVDNGFILAKGIRISSDYGKLMENLVFAELLKRGLRPNLDFFYYKTKNDREVDFVVKKSAKVDSLIQVSYSIENEKAEKRELSALIEASKELGCNDLILITWDREELKNTKGMEIKYIPLWKWLLSDYVA